MIRKDSRQLLKLPRLACNSCDTSIEKGHLSGWPFFLRGRFLNFPAKDDIQACLEALMGLMLGEQQVSGKPAVPGAALGEAGCANLLLQG